MDYEAKVMGGQLILLSKMLPAVDKKDVLDSLMYSQLYASREADKFEQGQAWFKRQADAQTNAKWITTNTGSYDDKLPKEKIITVQELMVSGVGHVVGDKFNLPVDWVASVLCALVNNESVYQIFRQAIVRKKSSCNTGELEYISDVSVQLSVVAAKGYMATVNTVLSVRLDVDENVFTLPFSGEEVVGNSKTSFSFSELDFSKFSRIRESVVKYISQLPSMPVMDICIPSPTVISAG